MRVFIFFHRERSNLIREEKRGAKCKRIRVLESSENIFVSSLVTLDKKEDRFFFRDLKILFRVTIRIYVTNAKKIFQYRRINLIDVKMLCPITTFHVDFISKIVNLTFRRLDLTKFLL